jgi:Ni/Co efflux regulator RcnB
MSFLFRQAIAYSAAFLLVVGQAEARQKQGSDIQVAADDLTTEQVVDRVFTTVERRILRRYYESREDSGAGAGDDRGGKHGNKSAGKGKNNNKGMPPGLARRGGNLPPGLAKRGGELPPGLAKRLPSDLERELPPRPKAYRRVVVDNDIVLIDAATNVVLDVLEDVLLGR